jgi:hypothetical protein
MEYDSDSIQSVVFIEPETNNVVIKITGFPNEDIAQLYIAWVMEELSFDYSSNNETINKKLH